MAGGVEHQAMEQVKTTITAACGQIRPKFGETEANLSLICRLVQQNDTDLIVFPELATSGYEFRSRDETLELSLDLVNGPEVRILAELASDTETCIVVGLPERVRLSVYNSVVLVQPDREITTYRKIHLFDCEKSLFEPGDQPPPVRQTPVGRIGLMICFDWIFPETARLLALDQAQVICHPSNLVLTYCQRAMFARSVENGVFTLTCNRIGSESRTDRTLTFTGQSQILSNRGEQLAQAGREDEEVITADITPSDADDKMITTHNHVLNDRRLELYGELLE